MCTYLITGISAKSARSVRPLFSILGQCLKAKIILSQFVTAFELFMEVTNTTMDTRTCNVQSRPNYSWSKLEHN